jgi:hypothetical protein
LIIAAWVGMTIIGLIVLGAIKDSHLSAGDPHRLTNAIDYQGHICGYDSGFKSLSKAFYLPDQSGIRYSVSCNFKKALKFYFSSLAFI